MVNPKSFRESMNFHFSGFDIILWDISSFFLKAALTDSMVRVVHSGKIAIPELGKFHSFSLLKFIEMVFCKQDDEDKKGIFQMSSIKNFSFVINFVDISFCFHMVLAWFTDGLAQRKLPRQWFIK